MKISARVRRALASAAVVLAGLTAATAGRAAALLPAGFNEPNIIIYGRVSNTLTNPPSSAYYGALVFTVTPASGAAFTVSAPLGSLANGAYSYKVEIPVQKVPTGFRLDASTIQTTANPANSTLAATVSGAPATLYASNGSAYSGTLAYAEVARGSIVQIDIRFDSSNGGTNPDSDNNGIADAWEIQYFGIIGVDPNADPDGDGESNLTEYQDGGDPLCYEWEKFLARYDLAGANADPGASPYNDGVANILQYALGGEPGITSVAAINQHIDTQFTMISGNRYLTLTIQRPAYRTCHVDYIVESSADLIHWGSAANTDIVVLDNQPTLLRVRDAVGPDGKTAAGKRFMRLRPVYKP